MTVRPPAETMDDVLTRMNRQLGALGRRTVPRVRVPSTSVATVATESEVPPSAPDGAAVHVGDTGAVLLRVGGAWDRNDPNGVPWTLLSFLRAHR